MLVINKRIQTGQSPSFCGQPEASSLGCRKPGRTSPPSGLKESPGTSHICCKH